MSGRAWVLGAALAGAGATPLAAQAPWPGWSTAWSALRPISVDARRLPFGSLLNDYSLGLSPRMGMLWSGGNPAGIARDVQESRAWLELSRSQRGGEYRRPLDPDGVGNWGLAGLGWRPLGRGAVAGRIGFDSRHADVATGTDQIAPYDADPFVVVDTTSPERSSTHAALEGAGGWNFGGWGVGLSLGADLHRDRSVNTRFSRVGRSSTSGIMVGVGREIAPLGFTIAVHGRWLGRSETHLLSTQPGPSTVYVLSGFFDRGAIDVSPPGAYYRRITTDGFAGGASAAGRTGSVEWTAFFERGTWDAAHINNTSLEDPPADRWESTATRLAGEVRLPLPWRLQLSLGAGYATLDGITSRSDLEGTVFQVWDAVLSLEGALELADPASAWQAALSFRSERLDLGREDYLADVRSDITSWLADVALVAGRHFGSTSAGVVLAVGLYTPAAAIPDPATMGPAYGVYIAPEQSLYAVAALPVSGGFWVRHRFGGAVAAYVRGGSASTSSRGPLPQIPALPVGERWQRYIALGIELTPVD